VRNVLVISYYFPPSGGPGVQRVLKFCRYLPRHGYRPLVLTVPETAAFPVLDPTLAAEIPAEARIYRAPIREFYGLYRRAAGTGPGSPVNLTTTARDQSGLRGRFLQGLRGAFFIPDGRMGWLPGGTRLGMEILRREPVDLIFASGPPFTAHWIGRRLAERTELPLVLDFRDPWTRAPFYPRRPSWARALDVRLERSCVRRAAAVVTVNRQIGSDLRAGVTGLPPERLHVLSNGFDPADFSARVPAAQARWTLVHTGTLPAGRFPEGFVPALASMLRDDPGLDGRMQVRFLGSRDLRLLEMLRQPPLDRVVRFEGYVPHQDSVQALLDSHLLLLFIEEGPQAAGMLTGKLFEYLGSTRPILALAPEGEAAELIRATRAGRVVRGNDVDGIRRALEEASAAHRLGRRAFGEPDPAAVERLSRVEITRQLAGLFDRILGAAG